MSIVDMRVKHKKYGTGVIVQYNENKIFVLFTNEEEPREFQFPMCFVNEFLSTTNSEDNKKIESIIDSLRCDICGVAGVNTETIDEKRYCTDCKNKHTTICKFCGKRHSIDTGKKVSIGDYYLKKEYICLDCANKKTFVCENCNRRLLLKHRSSKKLADKYYCKECYEQLAHECFYCAKPFDLNEGDWFPGYRETRYVCPECLDSHTFICSSCGGRHLENERVDSKYITKDMNICTECAYLCHKCQTYVDKEHIHEAFGNNYCSDCWDKYKVNCPICGDEFVPENSDSSVCDDCVEMEAYVGRVKKIDFSTQNAIELNYHSLESIDRCGLFTNLYKNYQCGNNVVKSSEDSYSILVLRILSSKVVVSYLPRSVTGKIKSAISVTMTEFRKNKYYWEVISAIRSWEHSREYIDTSVGNVELLNYPVLLRVQTEQDKIYGRQWNGPDDYIEIGNYGDTTNFYIIGVIRENKE